VAPDIYKFSSSDFVRRWCANDVPVPGWTRWRQLGNFRWSRKIFLGVTRWNYGYQPAAWTDAGNVQVTDMPRVRMPAVGM
jgi:hypothetical protein